MIEKEFTRYEARIVVDALLQYQYLEDEEEDYNSALNKARYIAML